MNQLRLTLKRTTEPASERPYLQTMLTGDGQPLVDFVYFNLGVSLYALDASRYQDGEHFIITCACGDHQCAGIRTGIAVRHSARSVEWIYRDPLPDPTMQPELLHRTRSGRAEGHVRGIRLPTRTYMFGANDYETAIVDGIEQIRQIVSRPENAALDTSPVDVRQFLSRH